MHRTGVTWKLTLDGGDEGDSLLIGGVVVEEEEPDTGVEELDERPTHQRRLRAYRHRVTIVLYTTLHVLHTYNDARIALTLTCWIASCGWTKSPRDESQ